MKNCVVGFRFSKDLSKVVLIKKNRPNWQAGKYNGIGGKIENNESPIDAICREFAEETSVETFNNEWKIFARNIRSVGGYEQDIYFLKSVGDITDVKTNTDEEIGIFDVNSLPDNTLYNLKWMIPLSLDKDLMTPIILCDKYAI